jgi:Asp-tRNA(Asn)/Glu-tRNA(Gln) amidotransferase C subunit
MSSITIDDDQLKALLKQALLELFEEKNELFYEALAEVIEELGLVKAIKEGQASPTVDKARVFEALERES